MSKWIGPFASGLVTALLALPAAAGAPGGSGVDELERFALRHVCENDEAIQCVAKDQNGFFTGAECSGTTTCEAQFVPGAEIRALLTIIADDLTPTNTQTADVGITVLFEFKVGDEQYAIADHYPGGDKIIEWFLFFDEDEIYNIDMGGGHILRADLAGVNDRLVQIGQTHFGITDPVVAVIEEGRPQTSGPPPFRRAPRKSPELEADESAVGNPLATIARYRVTILFGRTP